MAARCQPAWGALRRTCGLALLAAVAGVALSVSSAIAHVVFERPTLRRQAGEAALVAIVEFESGLSVWTAPDGSDHQEYFAVHLLQTLNGTPPPARFDFFPHAEGEPGFARGDRAIVFLEPTASRAEFVGLASRFPYFSVQRPGQEWTIAREGRSEAVELTQIYAALPRLPDAEALPALRGVLLRGLRSSDARLRADALAELVRARAEPGFFATAAAAAPFVRLVGPGRLAPSERVGLCLLLEGAPGFDADRALGALTKEPLPAPSRATLLRVALQRNDPTLRAWAETRRQDPDASVRREAQAALARAGVTSAPAAAPPAKDAPGPP